MALVARRDARQRQARREWERQLLQHLAVANRRFDESDHSSTAWVRLFRDLAAIDDLARQGRDP